MKKISKKKIIVFGAGYWGTIIVANLLRLGCKNIVVIDKSGSNLLLIRKRFKNKITTSINSEKYLRNKEYKYCFIATPPSQNFKLCKNALLNKKNIFVEKPLVNNLKDIKELIKIHKKNETSTFMVGYVYCYNEYVKRIKNIIDKKTLGEIIYIYMSRKNLGPIRNDVDVLLDLATHDVSILKFLFDKIPVIKQNIKYNILNKNNYDISNLHLKLNNIKIDINVSWLHPKKEREIIIIGKKKMLIFDELEEINKIKIYNKYAYYPKVNYFKKILTEKARIYRGNSENINIKSNDSLINELKYFFNCVDAKIIPITDLTFSQKVLSVFKKN